jgi:hypothetical protein
MKDMQVRTSIYTESAPSSKRVGLSKIGSSGRTRTYNPSVNSRFRAIYCQLLSSTYSYSTPSSSCGSSPLRGNRMDVSRRLRSLALLDIAKRTGESSLNGSANCVAVARFTSSELGEIPIAACRHLLLESITAGSRLALLSTGVRASEVERGLHVSYS